MNEAEARQLLAVEETASLSELKSAYRRSLKTWHPDLFDPDAESYAEAISNTQRINAAYQLLGRKRGDMADVSPLSDWYGTPVRIIERNETILIWGGLIFMVILAITIGQFV